MSKPFRFRALLVQLRPYRRMAACSHESVVGTVALPSSRNPARLNMGNDMTYTELSLLTTAVAHLVVALVKLWRTLRPQGRMIHKWGK